MQRSHHRIRVGLLASMVAHVLFFWFSPRIQPRDKPQEHRIEVALISHGDQPGKETAQQASPPPAPPTTTPAPPQPAAQPLPKPLPVAPQARFPLLVKRPNAPQTRPRQDEPKTWKAFESRRSASVAKHFPSLFAPVSPGGVPEGQDAVNNPGRDKCVPATQQPVDVVYLLYDSSGSMSELRRSQAISCANQYAKAAIEAGAVVIVGNFARSSTFSKPTRNMTDIAFALRAPTDNTGTILPSRELNPFLNQSAGLRSDLVVVSDGMIPNYREVLPWYRYFLELNPANRGLMYTVASPGHRDVTRALQSIGFDVYIYRVI